MIAIISASSDVPAGFEPATKHWYIVFSCWRKQKQNDVYDVF